LSSKERPPPMAKPGPAAEMPPDTPMHGPPANDGKLGPGGVLRPPLLEKSNTFPPDCAVDSLAGLACRSTSVFAPTDVEEDGATGSACATQDNIAHIAKAGHAMSLMCFVCITKPYF